MRLPARSVETPSGTPDEPICTLVIVASCGSPGAELGRRRPRVGAEQVAQMERAARVEIEAAPAFGKSSQPPSPSGAWLPRMCPFSPPMEEFVLPNAGDIVAAVRRIL